MGGQGESGLHRSRAHTMHGVEKGEAPARWLRAGASGPALASVTRLEQVPSLCSSASPLKKLNITGQSLYHPLQL